jgi:hypothetical protein
MPQIGGMQNTAQDFVQIRSLASSVPASAGHPNLPTRPESVVEPSLGPTPAIDRQKAAADNLSAAQRLKMELAGEPVPADNTEDGTAATLDAIASSTPIKLGRLSGANEVAVAANGEGPRGTKRTADEAGMPATRSEVEQEGVKTVEEQNGGDAEMEDASAAPAEPATNGYAAVTGKTPGELRISGNTAEQEDTVKYVSPSLLSTVPSNACCTGCGNRAIRTATTARSLASSLATTSSATSASLALSRLRRADSVTAQRR